MQVILLERIGRLGQMGDVVKVKDGYGRNFLLPLGKALRATKDNMADSQTPRGPPEGRNPEPKGEAGKAAQTRSPRGDRPTAGPAPAKTLAGP